MGCVALVGVLQLLYCIHVQLEVHKKVVTRPMDTSVACHRLCTNMLIAYSQKAIADYVWVGVHQKLLSA